MDLLPPLILTALICLAVGFALGYLVNSGRPGEDDRFPEIEPSVRCLDSHIAAAQPAGSGLQTLASPPLQRMGATKSPAQPVPRPSLNPVDALARVLQPDSNKPTTPKSIAAQVDDILQDKLAQTSPVETRKVRLVDVPEKGVVVMIGLDSYDGIDSVPDPGIRELIRASVHEWENRSLQNQKNLN